MDEQWGSRGVAGDEGTRPAGQMKEGLISCVQEVGFL